MYALRYPKRPGRALAYHATYGLRPWPWPQRKRYGLAPIYRPWQQMSRVRHLRYYRVAAAYQRRLTRLYSLSALYRAKLALAHTF